MAKMVKGMSKGKMPGLSAIGGPAPPVQAARPKSKTRNKKKKRSKTRR